MSIVGRRGLSPTQTSRFWRPSSAALMGEYVKGADDPWLGSPFAWIKTRPSRQVGSIGEQLVAGWFAAKGLDVLRTGDSDADRVIDGKRVEIKFSTLWESGDYVFQQIRNQRYDVALLLGLSPFAGSCWVVPKAVLLEQPFRAQGWRTSMEARPELTRSGCGSRPTLHRHGCRPTVERYRRPTRDFAACS